MKPHSRWNSSLALVVLTECLLFGRLVASPDLAITSFSGPSEVVANRQFEVTWNVSNVAADEARPSWTDTLYLSTDETLDLLDTPIGRFGRSLALAPDASYLQSPAVVLPSAPAGRYFLILKVDSDGQVLEANEGNNQRSKAITLTAPDLSVVDLRTSPLATAGQQIEATWTTRNEGSGEAVASWTDTLYFSTDRVLDATDSRLADFTRTISVQAGQDYLQSQTITVPSLPPGNYFLIVRADSENVLPELNEIGNERSAPVTIGLPDLTSTNLTAAASASTRQRFEVSWSVFNQGNVTARGSWNDQLFLSTDARWDASDLSLGSVSRSIALASSNAYVATITPELPTVPAGQYSLILRLDHGTTLTENDESNNERVVGFRVNTPNLLPAGFQFSRSALRGQSLPISWTVRCQTGSGDSVAPWTDQIYLSADDVWDPLDQLLAQFSHETPLAAGGSYSQFQSISLPAVNPGNWFLIVRVDGNNALYESNEADNDRAQPLTITVPDLSPLSLVSLPTAAMGQPLSVAWAVTNRGPVDALPSWTDRLYVSRDAVLDGEDQPIGDYSRSLTLGPGQSYDRSVTLPSFDPAAPELIQGTNLSTFANPERKGAITREFWSGVNGRFVREFDFQPNPVGTDELTNFESARDSADSFAARIRGFVHPPKTGIYTFWIAADEQAELWLSTDEDPANKALIAGVPDWSPTAPREWFRHASQRSRPVTLEAGRRYYIEALHKEESGSDHLAVGWQLPRDDFFLIVGADAGGQVTENNEGNNTLAIPIRIAAPDLAPTSFLAPLNAFAGQSIELNWGTTNRGKDSAVGSWTDRVYLSSDQRLDAQDVELASSTHDGVLQMATSYSRSIFAGLPQVPPGNYHLILRVDSASTVSEVDEANNILTVPLSVRSTDGVPTNFSARPSDGQITLNWASVIGAKAYSLYFGTALPLTKAVATRIPGVTPPFTHGGLNPGTHYYYFVIAEYDGDVESAPSGIVSAKPGGGSSLPDLVVQSVAAPATVAPRQRLDVMWSVLNQGSSDAQSSWTDQLYLSADDRWDASDLPLAATSRSSSAYIGDRYAPTAIFDFPLVAAGSYYLIVAADDRGNINEANESNNELAVPISVVAPDLRTTRLAAPSVAAVGQSIEITWTVENAGQGVAPPSWNDEVFLSSDPTWDITDQSLGSFRRDASVLPNGSYTTGMMVTVPAVSSGNWFVIIRSDQGGAIYESSKANNQTEAAIIVAAPDLAPTAFSAPLSAGIRQAIELTWSAKNQGNSATPGGWTDRIFLSRDDLLDSSDQSVTDVARSLPLLAGESYSASASFTIPTVPVGNWFLILRNDASSQIAESTEGNNDKVVPIELRAPDLNPVELVAQATAAVGQPLEVSWVVSNGGTGNASPSWTDQLFLSADEVWDQTDRLLTSMDRSATLPSGASYRVSTVASIPTVSVGDYFLILRTDHGGSLYESSKLNNERALPIAVATPDLVATDLKVPAVVFVRQTVEVSWLVKNLGTGDVQPSWTDSLFLSRDGAWGPNDLLLVAVGRGLPLASGEVYQGITSFIVPTVPPGDYQVILRVDHGQSASESPRSNNERIASMRIATPDLTPSSLIITKGSPGSQQLEATWTVRNLGEGVAPASWTDALFLSSDETWDITDTPLVGTTRSLGLEKDGTYAASAVVTLPALPARTYFIIVRTDRDNGLFEANEANNERAAPVSLSNPDLVPVAIQAPSKAVAERQIEFTARVENRAGDARPSWTDRVYFSTDELADVQDLVLGDFGQTQPLATGNGYSWTQRVPLPNVPPGKYFLILRADVGGNLFEANEGNNVFTHPIEITTVAVSSTPLRSLDASSFGSLSAPAFSPDGIRLAAVTGNQALLWDLQSGDLRRRFSGHSAAIDTVQFSPLGDQLLTGARDGSARLFDADTRKPVLSFSATPGQPDPASIAADGTRVLTGSGLNLPRFWDAVSGAEQTNLFGHTAQVIAVALTADASLAITGSEDRTAVVWDTATAKPVRTFTRHTAAVTAVAFSVDGARVLTGSADGSMLLWNLDSGAVEMAFVDGAAINSVGFSRDGKHVFSSSASPGVVSIWDSASGALLRNFRQGFAESPMNGAALSPDASLLATAHQDGFVRLWPTGLEVLALQELNRLVVGRPARANLRPHATRYYEFDIDSGRSFIIKLEPEGSSVVRNGARPASARHLASAAVSSDARFGNLSPAKLPGRAQRASLSPRFPAQGDEFAAVRVAASFGRLPSAYDADLFGVAGLDTLAVEIPVAAKAAGKLYVVVFSPYLSDGALDLEVGVQYTDFHLSGVSASTAGNAGTLTVELRGTGLTADTVARLLGPGGNAIDGSLVQLSDSTRGFVSFDLRAALPGSYDVQLEKPSAPPARLNGPLQVSAGTGPRLEARLIAPTAVRPQRDYNLVLEYANVGDADMAAPLFIVRATSPSLFPLAKGLQAEAAVNTAPTFSQMQFLGINFDGPASILPPGARFQIPLRFRAPAAGNQIIFNLDTLRADSTAIDWTALEPRVRPPELVDELWHATWSNFKLIAGNTWAEYLLSLGNQALLLGQSGSPTADLQDIFSAMLSQAAGASLRQTLAANVDAVAPTPGLILEFSHLALDTMESRFTVGILGRAWTHNLDYTLSQPHSSVVLIKAPGGGSRRFSLGTDNVWRAALGDYGVLRGLEEGGFELREPDGLSWTFNAQGQLVDIGDLNRNTLTLTYDIGRLVQIAHSAGPILQLGYSAQGRLAQLTDHAGRITHYEYDAVGEHLLRVIAPGEVVTTYGYAPVTGSARDHALISIAFPDNTHQFFAYDARGRLSEYSRDGGGERLRFTYDTFGRVSVRDANDKIVLLDLGDRGQVMQSFDQLRNRTAFSYDAAINLTRIVTPGGASSELIYDDNGNAIRLTNPLGHEVVLGYAPNSRLDTLTDARANLIDFDHDAAGNLTKITYPDGSAENFAYNPQGKVTTKRNRRGQVIEIARNAAGQMTRKSYPDGRQVDYTYDARGKLIKVTDSTQGITAMEYDSRGFLSRINYPDGKGFLFEHNDSGRRTKRTGFDGYVVEYAYDSVGRLRSLTGGGKELSSYTYDPVGRLNREEKGNGTSTTYEYDATGQLLAQVNWAKGGSVQSSFAYAYDERGNRISMTTSVGVTRYSYDLIGQLTAVTYPDGRTLGYVYDAAGNRMTVTESGMTTAYASNGLNQYTQVGAADYTYDADGNLTSKASAEGTTRYEYDVENRLVRVTTDANTTWEYGYDSFGNRISVTHAGKTYRYLHDPRGLVDVAAEYDEAGTLTARYEHGLGLAARIDSSGSVIYYAYDALGNTRENTDSSGGVVNRYDYDAFGAVVLKEESVPNPFGFVGRFGVMDGNGDSLLMRRRHYLLGEGRFTSPDPLGVRSGDINLYTYVGNNPANVIDPIGLGYFGKRPLDGLPVMFNNPLDDYYNTEISHEHYFFDDGTNIGFAPDGRFSEIEQEMLNQYRPSSGNYDDDLMREALKRLQDRPYRLIPDEELKDNCQSWADRLRDEYERVKQEQPLDEESPQIIRPIDPNDKLAPAGIGAQRLISTDEPIEYMVRFENFKTATAPVQELVVVDYLDQGLDWTTVEFGHVAYGERLVNLPPNTLYFSTRDLPPTNSPSLVGTAEGQLALDVSATFNAQTGRMEWRVKCIDTATGTFPEDPFAGFLPPENGTGRGNGHVTFRVKPRADAALGTVVTNKASIIFDTNDPIDTPPVWNTLADVAPKLGISIAYAAAEIPPGVPFTYTVTLTNPGLTELTGVKLTNALPAGVTVVSSSGASGGCIEAGSLVICDVGTVAAGGSTSVQLTVTPTEPGPLELGVSAGGNGGSIVATKPIQVTVGAGTAPRLDIEQESQGVRLSWPLSATGYGLEVIGELNPGLGWQPVNAVVQDEAGIRSVIINSAEATRFYRLRK